jgi:hypothetical protein
MFGKMYVRDADRQESLSWRSVATFGDRFHTLQLRSRCQMRSGLPAATTR